MTGRHRPVPAAFGLSPGLLQTLLLRDEVDLVGELCKDSGLGLGVSPRIDRVEAGPLEGRGGDRSVESLIIPLLPTSESPPCELGPSGKSLEGRPLLPLTTSGNCRATAARSASVNYKFLLATDGPGTGSTFSRPSPAPGKPGICIPEERGPSSRRLRGDPLRSPDSSRSEAVR